MLTDTKIYGKKRSRGISQVKQSTLSVTVHLYLKNNGCPGLKTEWLITQNTGAQLSIRIQYNPGGQQSYFIYLFSWREGSYKSCTHYFLAIYHVQYRFLFWCEKSLKYFSNRHPRAEISFLIFHRFSIPKRSCGNQYSQLMQTYYV